MTGRLWVLRGPPRLRAKNTRCGGSEHALYVPDSAGSVVGIAMITVKFA